MPISDPIELIAALEHPNVKAFQWMLRFGEGTQGDDGYRVIFGGGHFAGLDGIPGTFDDFADHPRTVVTRTMRGRLYKSSAAGAYQAMPPSWDETAAKYGLKDFSPRNQDLFCVGRIVKRKALDDIIAGRFEQAVRKCAWEWASLPGSPYGQPVVTMQRARQEYEAAGGSYAPDTPTAAQQDTPPLVHTGPEPVIPVPIATPIPKESIMAPFLAALLPHLISAVPELAKTFGSGSEVSERNIKAAEVVAGIAKDALGARNEQEVMDTMKSDPAAVATVRAAIQDNWYQLVEVGGGVEAAAQRSIKMQGDRGMWANPALWVSGALLVFPMMLCVDVFYVHPLSYDANLRTQIVTAILGTILAVGAFWLGSSRGSQQKDEIAAGK